MAVALFPSEPTPTDPVLPVTWQTIEESDLPIVDYVLLPPPGRYGYLVVAWIGEGTPLLDLASWVELGIYADPGDPASPGVVEIVEGSTRIIDLTADLSRVPTLTVRRVGR